MTALAHTYRYKSKAYHVTPTIGCYIFVTAGSMAGAGVEGAKLSEGGTQTLPVRARRCTPHKARWVARGLRTPPHHI
ncbi:hypothetical protein EVAR_13089_1 [Eumeta japonica]|uniref:Uncharacterized protein n=1 Tax=Eumeta variegata TaxID=151549 RepID=A0A4C1UAD3_EUMVA|nr:hypothetical protein EVAR_13089_1 [Eumeta japonica]